MPLVNIRPAIRTNKLPDSTPGLLKLVSSRLINKQYHGKCATQQDIQYLMFLFELHALKVRLIEERMGIINIVESLVFLCPSNQFLGLRCLSKEFLGLTCLNKHRCDFTWTPQEPGVRFTKPISFSWNNCWVECHYNAVQYTMIYIKQHCNERVRI